MGKKKNVSATAIENLKTLNNQLVKEVYERRKQIEQLRFHLASLVTDREILAFIERDVLGLVLSSSLSEAAARRTKEMAAVMKKTESAAAELNAAEVRLLSLVRERDAIQRDMKRIIQKREVADPKRGGRTWKKWICPVAAMATVATAAVVALCCCSKGSGLKN